jgi:hypothetical protein
MTTAYMSKTIADLAEDVQNRHRADPEGFCAFHQKHFHVRIPVGKCASWLLAQTVIVARYQQQTRTLPQGPVAGRFWFEP